jgi:hypothetical protein
MYSNSNSNGTVPFNMEGASSMGAVQNKNLELSPHKIWNLRHMARLKFHQLESGCWGPANEIIAQEHRMWALEVFSVTREGLIQAQF